MPKRKRNKALQLTIKTGLERHNEPDGSRKWILDIRVQRPSDNGMTLLLRGPIFFKFDSPRKPNLAKSLLPILAHLGILKLEHQEK